MTSLKCKYVHILSQLKHIYVFLFPLGGHTKSLRCFMRPFVSWFLTSYSCSFISYYSRSVLPPHPHKHAPCPCWKIFRSFNRWPCFFLLTKTLYTHLILLRTFYPALFIWVNTTHPWYIILDLMPSGLNEISYTGIRNSFLSWSMLLNFNCQFVFHIGSVIIMPWGNRNHLENVLTCNFFNFIPR